MITILYHTNVIPLIPGTIYLTCRVNYLRNKVVFLVQNAERCVIGKYQQNLYHKIVMQQSSSLTTVLMRKYDFNFHFH